MTRYREKPPEIEAIQLRWSTWNQVCSFLDGVVGPHNPARMVTAADVTDTCGEPGPEYIEFTIPTALGRRIVRHGEYVIKHPTEGLQRMDPESFERTYQEVG